LGRDVLYAAGAPITPRLTGAAPVELPGNFIGLGFEMSSVATPGLLSAGNQRYVELIRNLGAQGVLRVGGIVADYTRYEANGTAIAERQNTVINRASLEQFGGFLEKTGWQAIWSVNLAQGSLEDAVVEARAVAEVLGSRLLALELGNEVENYSRGAKPFRKLPYDYEAYRREYDEWHAAIVKAVPGMRFAAPDTASSVEWVERMAKDAKAAKDLASNVQLLTTHYYREYQKRGSAEQLLHADPRLNDALVRLRAASRESGIPWRMCETNSFSGGGLPGVSDTFVGALWTLDYMMLLAEYGCAGVNIETGVNQLGFISSYSPIVDDGKGPATAGPSYYGMLAFATASKDCPEVLPIDFDAQGINMTAYTLGAGGKPRSVVVVNKDRVQDANLSLKSFGMKRVSVLRLSAPSAESKTGITFGGSGADTGAASEGWRAVNEESISDGMVHVPRMSAVVVRASGRAGSA
jgi:hypothetical protein